MLVEYLRAARLEPSVEVATALFYGIKTDTRDLGRQTTPRTSRPTSGSSRASTSTCSGGSSIPDLPAEYFRLYHLAIEQARVYGAVGGDGDLGEVYYAGHGGRGRRAAHASWRA